MSTSPGTSQPDAARSAASNLESMDGDWEREVQEMEMRLARARRKKDRMKALNELSKLTRRARLAQSVDYLRQAIQLARDVAEELELGYMIAQLGRLLHHMRQADEARKFLEEALAILERYAGTELKRTEILRLLAGTCLEHGDFAPSISLLQSAIGLSRMINDARGLSEGLSFLGQVLTELADYDQALQMLEEALELARSVTDLERVAQAYNCIATVQQLKGEQRGALNMLHHALDVIRSIGSKPGEGVTLANIATSHIALMEFDIALEYIDTSLAIFEELGWKVNMAASFQSAGECYVKLEQWDKGFAAFERGIELAMQAGARGQLCRLKVAYGSARIEHGDLDIAFATHQSAEEIAKTISLDQMLCTIHYNYALIHEQRKNFELAFSHMKLYAQEKEKINAMESERRLAAMQIRMQMERTEKEKEIFRIKAEQLRQDMEQKNRELAAMALQQAQTAEMVTRLRKSIRSFEPQHGDIGKRLAGELLQHLGQAGNDTQWRSFEERFTPVHPDFARNLTECCPELTPTEMKVCTLLKVSMSTKEIAAILGTSVRTVEGHRRFIRKRLSLAPEQSLSMFLATL